MTCTSCEVLIERKLKNVPGVEKVTVSRAQEEAEISCDEKVTLEQLQYALKDKGYALTEKSNEKENGASKNQTAFFIKDQERWSEIGAVLVVLIGGFILLKQLDILPKNIGVTDGMGYGFVFIIGLVAAASTCLAVAGGLLLSISAKYHEQYPHLTRREKFIPHLSFNVGRIASYTILGGVIGWLGSTLTLSETITGVITLVASLFMVLIGLQLLGVFPWLQRFQLKMPKFLAHKIYDASSAGKPSNRASFLFGAATFFLPCGFTQALQLYVLGKGDAVTGALTMLAFSLGTLPSLISIGAFSSFAKGNALKYFTTFSAVLVIFLGVYNIPSGLTLTGANTLFLSDEGTGNDFGGGTGLGGNDAVPIIDGKQIVTMKVDGLDYSPSRFTVKSGVPVEWHVDGSGAQGCAQILSLRQMGITERLSRSEETVITFTPQQAGTLQFSCSMGMAGPGFFEVV